MVFMVPDVLVPYPAGSCFFPYGCPADYACLDEQGQVPVHRSQRQAVALCLEEIEHMIGVKVTFNIANSLQ